MDEYLRRHVAASLLALSLVAACAENKPADSLRDAGNDAAPRCADPSQSAETPAVDPVPDDSTLADQAPEQGSVQDGAALPGGDGVQLPFSIVDAEYSAALNRMVIVSRAPNRLIVLDPESLEYSALRLPLAPSSVSVHPDGRSAAVGHDQSLSIVQLDPLQLTQRIAASINVADVIFSADRHLYAFPPPFTAGSALAVIDLATGVETKTNPGVPKLRLHPHGDRMYGVTTGIPSALARADITNGVPKFAYEWPYHGEYPVSGDLWLTQDGARILSSSGHAFRSSDVRADDMKYVGALEGYPKGWRFDHSSAAHSIALIHFGSSQGSFFGDPNDVLPKLSVFEDTYLNFRQTLVMPKFVACGTEYATEPDFAFFSADGTRLYALVEVDPAARIRANGIVRFDVGALEAPPTLPPATVTDGTVLDFAIVDAEYSRRLERVIGVQRDPHRLLIIEPSSATFEAIDLPLPPTAVSLRRDGKQAAIGHDGWISLVDLEQKKVLSTQPVAAEVFDIVLSDSGYAYAFPGRDQWVDIFSLQLGSGMVTYSSMQIYEHTVARLHPDGDRLYAADTKLTPSNIERLGISSGTAQVSHSSPYHGDYEMCGNLWFSEDGARVFTACGNIFRASNVEREDMTYVGALAGVPRKGLLASVPTIASLDHSAAAGLVAAGMLPKQPPARGEVLLFDHESLEVAGQIDVSDVLIDGEAYPSTPRFVFFDAGGTRISIIAAPNLPPGTAPRTVVISTRASAP